VKVALRGFRVTTPIVSMLFCRDGHAKLVSPSKAQRSIPRQGWPQQMGRTWNFSGARISSSLDFRCPFRTNSPSTTLFERRARVSVNPARRAFAGCIVVRHVDYRRRIHASFAILNLIILCLKFLQRL